MGLHLLLVQVAFPSLAPLNRHVYREPTEFLAVYVLVVAVDGTLRLSGLLSREPEARGSALHYV